MKLQVIHSFTVGRKFNIGESVDVTEPNIARILVGLKYLAPLSESVADADQVADQPKQSQIKKGKEKE